MNLKIDIRNRKASFDYFFIEGFNAGIQLMVSEVKSIINGKISLVDSFCYIEGNEIFVAGMSITENGSFSHNPLRKKKLLLKRKEIKKIQRELLGGLTIVVKRIFSNPRGKIKAEIAIARGKKNHDKRQSIKEREISRELKKSYNTNL